MMQLNNDYQRDDFIKFLEEDFLTDFKRDVRPVNTSSLTCINKAQYLGESKTLDLQVFEFVFEGSANKRVALTKDAFSVMRSSAIYNALAVFHTEDNKDWRFSLLTATPEPTEKGKVSLTYSNPKRLSFFLGPNAKINTPTRFLQSKGKIVDFEDLKSRFSIEVVNKEFYKEISQAFTKLVGGQLKLPSTQDKSQTNLEFAVRLIGRIIFCWFLREKKSDAGLSLMPKELLSIEAVQGNKDYYHTILEPIFFEVLNKPVKSRREEFAKEPFASVPYLNGGLFSPQEDDFYKRMNGDFQSQFHNTLVIPDSWLNSFFEILETYNFTIDENTSYDEELSIDPEMLGRIFENLLAEINPETGESARKSTGSYYTPRTIVNYMVDESLLLYLKEQTEIKEEKLRAIISYDLSDDSENPVSTEEKEKIIEALEKVKILDPACGSGAFPIGALQKIVFILQQTDPDGQLWFKKQIKNTSPEVKRVIEREFEHKNFDYIRKLGIIRENIYGVDIQAIATEISRLRCFLTLIADERIQDGTENRGIEPLPNLDFKFVTANSLIGLPKIDLSQQSMFDDYQKIDDLKNIRDQYFNASGIEREQLKTEFVTQQKRLVDQLIKEHGFMGVAKAELTQKLTDWEPFTHKSTSWFDSEWMFGIKEGFDIVVANPPYSLNLATEYKGQLRKIYRAIHFKLNLFACFIEKGVDLIRKKGVLTFINPNLLFANDSLKKLRKLLLEETSIQLLMNLGDGVFESATVPTMIFLLKNEKNVDNKIKIYPLVDDMSHLINYFEVKQSDYLKKFNFVFETVNKKTQKLLDKIYANTVPLGELLDINQGLITGDDKKYLSNSSSDSSWKQTIRGKDIERFATHYPNLYVNYLPDKLACPRTKTIFEVDEKLLMRRTADKPIASYDDRSIYNLHTLYSCRTNNNRYHLLFLLGLINSRLFTYIYRQKLGTEVGRTFAEIKIVYIRKLPVATLSLSRQEAFVNVVKKIIQLKKNTAEKDLKELSTYEDQINQMVYKLYRLTPDEIEIIENEN